MSFYTPLPVHPNNDSRSHIDIVDGKSTAVQRALRRDGLAGYEAPTVAAFLAAAGSEDPGFVFFDVGANIGLYSALCGALFDPAHVIAFEPTPDTARIARKIARVNRLPTRVEELALGQSPGMASLYLSAKSDASNSLVEGFKESVGTIEVDVRTLDDYVNESCLIPDIIKIDAETFEPDILAGSREVLTTHRPLLIVEALHRRGRDHGVDVTTVMDGLGYFYYDISTYSEWQPRTNITGDPEGEDRDWLLSPEPLPENFGELFELWETAVSSCTEAENYGKLPARPRDESQQIPYLNRVRKVLGRARRAVRE